MRRKQDREWVAETDLRKKKQKQVSHTPNNWQEFQAPELDAVFAIGDKSPTKEVSVIEEVPDSRRRGGFGSWSRMFKRPGPSG